MPVNSMAGRTRSAPGRAGIIEVMSNSSSRRFPVTTTDLPVTRCHFKVAKADLAFDEVTISEYLTFMEIMARADIHLFVQ